jgi:S-DNA-T family DNA segregation ATPase FtsK/SpoIIIE
MSKCAYPEHHGTGKGGTGLLAAAIIALVAWKFRHLIIELVIWAGVVVGLVLAAAAVVLAVRLVRRPEMSAVNITGHLPWLHHVPRAAWAAARWHHLTRNLGLAYPDRHKRGKTRRPRAIVHPSRHGVVARVRTVPGSGREEFDRAAAHIGNYWKCVRVSVSQPKPGRLIVRGLRTDPLTVPFPEAEIPAEAFTPVPDLRALRFYLGRDEWAAHRWLPVANTPGATVGGLPGFGKTKFVRLILAQLERREVPHRLTVIDGKGSADYDDLRGRCRIFTLDDLGSAAAALGEVHGGMRDRLGSILDLTGGYTNGWHTGPTADMPLDITIIDEAHSFFCLDLVKGDREAEKTVRQCIYHTSQVIKKGRSALQLVLVLTQKQTSDAVPTSIRDVCAAGMSFACRTRDGAVAALGEQIRQYESYCPSGLNSPEFVGVMTTSLRSGRDPFTRIRVPQLAASPAWPSVVVPDDASSLDPASAGA